jgi:valyl-tRNA synthetase
MSQRELPPAFVSADVEGPLYDKWVAAGYFTADAKSKKVPFTIVIPPPNVNGNLHIGHALDHTLQDILIRWKRMKGFEALWLPGMDHAGIAMQNVVEKQLAAQGLTRQDIGRAEFVKKVWEWKQEYGGQILGQMRRLGDSVDWTRERFTMDEGLSQAVLTIFKRLYDAGLIYRAERIINWCPRCMTAISDIEVDHSDEAGELIYIRYGDGERSIVVATTRAETMLGDTAVAVHPEDVRYSHLIGKTITLPLVGREIPIIADAHVDPEFGTGAVKVTPAHDPNDFEIGLRHNLESIVILSAEAVVENSGTAFDGMDRFIARRAVVERLREQGRIVEEKRPYIHAVGHCQRCETTIEPRLSKQWFVKVAPLAKAAGDAVRDGRVKIEPESLSPRYFEWIDNMHDWCISRQLWWGHRIPVWYGPAGEIFVTGPGESPPEGYLQDNDVLDTWFSSALWPFSTLGWPNETEDLKKFYPTSVLVTGYDILFFWVARMMLFGLFAMDGVPPFAVIALHGMVRDKFGKKMSKSRGNGIDPIEFMDRYGADAVRFTLARGANPGADLALAEEWVAGARNFATKLWNATRFAMLNGATVAGELPAFGSLGAIDRWILSRLNQTVVEVDALLEKFEFARASELIYHFAWDDLCDWYLELSKEKFSKGDAAKTQRVLGFVLDQLLRLLHPTMPFVTEELWTAFTGGESLVISTWPKANPAHHDVASEKIVAQLQEIITEVRRFRNDQGIKTSQRVPGRFILSGDISTFENSLRYVLRIDPPAESFATGGSVEIGQSRVEFDLSGSVDIGAERVRLTKDLATARKDHETALVKINNENFMAKAPANVVVEIKARLASTSADIERLALQLSQLPAP